MKMKMIKPLLDFIEFLGKPKSCHHDAGVCYCEKSNHNTEQGNDNE
jgi:hypothetical protein